MKRPLALMSAIILALSLAAPATASTAPAPMRLEAPLAEFGPCEDTVQHSRNGGNYIPGNLYNIKAVVATIDPVRLTFGPCSEWPGNDAAAAWVALEPTRGWGTGYSGSAIVQLGIVRCNFVVGAVCDRGDVQYFWAYGGCWGVGPTLRLLPSDPPSPRSPHTFQIVHWTNTILGYIDGQQVFGLDENAFEIGCWAPQAWLRATIAGETLDGGDSLADSTDKLDFKNVRVLYWEPQAYWRLPGWSASDACDKQMPDSNGLDYRCDVTSDDDFVMWSVRK